MLTLDELVAKISVKVEVSPEMVRRILEQAEEELMDQNVPEEEIEQ